ncbi:MAG: NAD(P)H-hydrate dehydratase [Rhodothermales bacterium]|nr:NAD(P)H-hydrate dehydratase [Rhodothermales bacterium]
MVALPAPALSAAAMRAADQVTIDEWGLPGFTLMETAGRAAVHRIEHAYGAMAGKRVHCFCGKGNNGGDGFVVARVLHARGARVRVIALAEAEAMTEDAARNWRLLEHLAAHDAEDRIALARFESLRQVAAFGAADLLVDALLGTGLTSALREPVRSLVAWINEQPTPCVALDVPTGLHTDHGRALGEAVRADLTVTMGALKTGLLVNDGPVFSGRIDVAEIGIPRAVLEEQAAAHDGCAWQADDATVAGWLPERGPGAHKYSAGLALVVAGSPGMTGAPVMAARAAYRAGAGFVTCVCHEAIETTLAAKLTEVTTRTLPGTDDGGIDPEGALEALARPLEKARSLLIGPGLGQHPETQRFIRTLLTRIDVPAVLDADALNALAADPAFLAEHARGRWILTPHAGEFRRLAGDDVDLDDRVRTAQHFARRWNSVLVLKGLPSLVAAPDGTAFVNATGGPALATAGTGDVLAGLCVGLLAQGLAPLHAAVAALHLGGAAADRYAARRAARSMVATDLLAELPAVLHERFR